MKINYNSTGAIIIQFPQFAGGKFISNCLALSRFAVPQDAATAEYLLNNPADYNYRFARVASTLPETVAEMRSWISKYEFGDTQQKPALAQLSISNLNFFLVSHQPDITAKLLALWKNAKVIVLTNFRQFSNIACERKNNGEIIEEISGNYCIEKYNLLKGNDWPTWKEFNTAKFDINNISNVSTPIKDEISKFYMTSTINTIGFDIDNCIFEKSKFLSAMSDLYRQLHYDDFNAKLVGNFWQSYIELHIDKRQNTQYNNFNL
jgi:hypothetical protein